NPGSASGIDFKRTHTGRQFIQDAIDKFEAVGAAKFLGQLHRFVNGNFVRHIHMVNEFVTADKQNTVLDGRKLVQRTVDIGHECFTQRRRLGKNAMQQRLEPDRIRVFEFRAVLDVSVDGACLPQVSVATDQPGINALKGKFARPAARTAMHCFIILSHSLSYRLGVSATSSVSSSSSSWSSSSSRSSKSSSSSSDSGTNAADRLAISTATWAQSLPFCSARAFACSSSSVVRIP